MILYLKLHLLDGAALLPSRDVGSAGGTGAAAGRRLPGVDGLSGLGGGTRTSAGVEHRLVDELGDAGDVVVLGDDAVRRVPFKGNQGAFLGVFAQPLPTVPSGAPQGARGIAEASVFGRCQTRPCCLLAGRLARRGDALGLFLVFAR